MNVNNQEALFKLDRFGIEVQEIESKRIDAKCRSNTEPEVLKNRLRVQAASEMQDAIAGLGTLDKKQSAVKMVSRHVDGYV